MTITPEDHAANQAAEFLPPTEPDALPALRVGGHIVLAYLSDGIIQVTISSDDASAGADGLIPMRVMTDGGVLFEHTGPATAEATPTTADQGAPHPRSLTEGRRGVPHGSACSPGTRTGTGTGIGIGTGGTGVAT